MKIGVQARFELYGTMKRDGEWYVAYCSPLDIGSQGRTPQEARENLIEAAQMFLASCLERGTLDQALKELQQLPSLSVDGSNPTGYLAAGEAAATGKIVQILELHCL